MEELLNKYIVVMMRMDHSPSKPYVFHGKLRKFDEKSITMDDVKLGHTIFPRGDIVSIREMTRSDMIILAEKYDKWLFRLKFEQADDKVKERFNAITEYFKKLRG